MWVIHSFVIRSNSLCMSGDTRNRSLELLAQFVEQSP